MKIKGKLKNRLTYGDGDVPLRDGALPSDRMPGRLFAAVLCCLTLIWCILLIFTFAIAYVTANDVCHHDFSLGVRGTNFAFNCTSISASIAVALTSLKSIAVLRFSGVARSTYRHSVLTWAIWCIAIMLEISVGIAATSRVASSPNADPFLLSGLIFLWSCCVLVTGLLPAILLAKWQLLSVDATSLDEVEKVRRRENPAHFVNCFNSIPDLLRKLERDPLSSILDVTVGPDGWVSVSQRRLSALLDLPLSSVHDAVRELRQSDLVRVDTSQNISRFRLVTSEVADSVLPCRTGGSTAHARAVRERNTQNTNKQKKTLPNNVVHGRWKRAR